MKLIRDFFRAHIWWLGYGWMLVVNVIYAISIFSLIHPWSRAIWPATYIVIATVWSYLFGKQRGKYDSINKEIEILEEQAREIKHKLIEVMSTTTLVRWKEKKNKLDS